VDYPDLVSDFAGFLLPEQAVECASKNSFTINTAIYLPLLYIKLN
jgi:hypothetical protein